MASPLKHDGIDPDSYCQTDRLTKRFNGPGARVARTRPLSVIVEHPTPRAAEE